MLAHLWKLFAPRPRLRMAEWCAAHVRLSGTIPWDDGAYPHLAAPLGPCEAVDDPAVRRIWLVFGTRLAKTSFGLSFLVFAQASPAPGMLVSPDQKLAQGQVTTKLYPMLEASPWSEQLPPPHRRNDDRIDLAAARIFVGWARSVSTLADKSVKYGLANELDKWTHPSTSAEADPLELFNERHKDWPRYKFIFEGTPTVKHRSRIEAGLLASDDRRYWVPCPRPKCRRYQRLDLGDGSAGGLRWDKTAAGHSDQALARETARYVCAHCEAEIGDESRGWMMRRGVWVPRGCMVRDREALRAAEKRPAGEAGYLKGAWRPGLDAGFQLSSLYALSLSWGDYAAEFVRASKKTPLMRNFVNGWKAETWEYRAARTLPQQLAERIGTNELRGRVPSAATYLTVGVDRQGAAGGFSPFIVLAHGAEERSYLVEWGEAESFSELWREVLTRQWPHADGGPPLVAMLALLDSGFETLEVYRFCEGKRGVLPCKGAAGDAPYRVVELGLGRSRASRTAAKGALGQTLVHVNTDFWETDLAGCLEDRRPGEAGSLTLPIEAGKDADLCEQLLNATIGDRADSRGLEKLLWIKKDPGAPNDYRDAMRYARCAGRIVLDERGGRLPVRAAAGTAPAARTRPAVINAGEGRPDGRPWV